MALPQRGQEFLEHMTLAGIGTRPLVLIAHSLGGLVVKYALFQSMKAPEPDKKRLAGSNPGICFLATPHQGADIAKVIVFLGGVLPVLRISESVRELRANSPYLIELEQRLPAIRRGTAPERKGLLRDAADAATPGCSASYPAYWWSPKARLIRG